MAENEKKCSDCIYESIIEELKRDADRNSDQHREFYNKFNEQDKAIAISDERYTNLLQSMNRLENSINNISICLTDLKDKPAKRWDNVVTTIISCIVTGVIAFFLARIGM